MLLKSCRNFLGMILFTTILIFLQTNDVSSGNDPKERYSEYYNQGAKAVNSRKWDEAEKYMRLALEVSESFDPQDPTRASARNNLGVALLGLGRTDEAIQMFSEGLTLLENNANTVPAQLALQRNNIAHLKQDIGAFKDAEAVFRKAIAVQDKTGPREVFCVSPIQGLAELQYLLGDLDSAQANLTIISNILKNDMRAKGSWTFASDREAYLLLASRVQLARDSLSVAEDIFDNLKKLEKGPNSDVNRREVRIELLLSKGNFKEANRLASENFSEVKRKWPSSPGKIGRAQRYLGQTQFYLQEYNDALSELEQSVHLLHQYHGNNHPTVAEALFYRGLTEEALGKTKTATESFKEAQRIFSATCKVTQPVYSMLTNHLR